MKRKEPIIQPDNSFSTLQLSRYWGVQVKTLAKWRSEGNGIGPEYIKRGHRVFYMKYAIDAYEKNRTYRGSGERVFPDEGGDNGNEK